MNEWTHGSSPYVFLCFLLHPNNPAVVTCLRDSNYVLAHIKRWQFHFSSSMSMLLSFLLLPVCCWLFLQGNLETNAVYLLYLEAFYIILPVAVQHQLHPRDVHCLSINLTHRKRIMGRKSFSFIILDVCIQSQPLLYIHQSCCATFAPIQRGTT